MMVSLGNDGGYWMLALVWSLAIVGLLLDTLLPKRIEIIQIAIYLVMGWVCVFKYSTLAENIPHYGVVLLVIGGVSYTGGVIFYVLDTLNKLRHAHGVWHIFVLIGSLSHFISIAGYVR